MSDYNKSTNFAAKDSLPSGNAAKIVKGTEIDTEFSNIETAIATKANSSDVTTSLALKADKASPTFTGTPAAPTAAQGTNTTQLATTAFVHSAALGVGQTAQSMMGSRALGSTYTNSTGKPIMVWITVSVTNGTVSSASIDGLTVAQVQSNQATQLDYGTMTLVVPNGSTYGATNTGATLVRWVELR